MKYRKTILALLMMTPASLCLYAQTTDGPPVNTTAVMATLNQVKKQQQTDIKSAQTNVAQTLMSKASSVSDAIEYYTEAVFATQFNGMNHEAKELQDWKKRHEADFKDPNFRDALCLHLMYLSLTVQHDSGAKVKDLLPSLLTYTQQVETDETGLAGQEELMGTSLAKSVFVRYLEIGQYVTDDDTWELIPIKVDGIYTKVILPEYRLEKNADAIFQYWDGKIARAEAEAENTKRPLDLDKFTKITKPSLLWQRYEEYVGLGQKNNAITNMVALIKANPYHPDAPGWIDEVEKLVKASAPAPVPVATPAPAPIAADPTPTPTPPNPIVTPIPNTMQPPQN